MLDKQEQSIKKCVKGEIQNLKLCIDRLSAEFLQMKQRQDGIEKKTSQLEQSVRSVSASFDAFDNKLDKLEGFSRRDNLRFFGVPETGAHVSYISGGSNNSSDSSRTGINNRRAGGASGRVLTLTRTKVPRFLVTRKRGITLVVVVGVVFALLVALISESAFSEGQFFDWKPVAHRSSTEKHKVRFFKTVAGQETFLYSAIANYREPEPGEVNIIITAFDSTGTDTLRVFLGVDHIQLMDLDNPEPVQKVFRYYRDMGLLDPLPYELPDQPHWVPQQASHDETFPILDCRQRLAGYTYVMGVDMD
nr:hypothetical protein BaRGS_013180 [Batillaria attramentaria]